MANCKKITEFPISTRTAGQMPLAKNSLKVSSSGVIATVISQSCGLPAQKVGVLYKE